MSIFDQGPRAVTEWAKEEIADILIKGVEALFEDNQSNGDWGLDEEYEINKQKERILKFLNMKIVDGRAVKRNA